MFALSAALFAVAMACLWAVAAAWDTAWRLWLIGGLGAAFGLVAVWALLTLRRLSRDARQLLSRTGVEWQKDRQLFEELLPPVPDGVP